MPEPTPLPTGERDLDWVVVTGAGASREFGVGPDKFPLMAEWSRALLQTLHRVPSYAELTGLEHGMSGEQFEIQLGRFLRQVEAFGLIKPLLGPSLQFGNIEPAMHITSMAQWHKSTVHHLGEITELIRESLYEQFAERRHDPQRALAAYSSLFGTLGIATGTRWVYATTNYDTIGEQVIRDAGFLPDWGQPPTVGNEGERPIHIPGLLDGVGRYVPVLHLHGRVGWFRRDECVYGADITKYQRGFGVPVVMLPDPDKAYDQDDTIIAMWQQFDEALTRAKRVFVLGHSLNDRHLVRALTHNVEPASRIAVTVLSDEMHPDQPDPSTVAVAEKISSTLPGAAIIPLRFGTHRDAGRQAIQKWLG